jgi:hypothetical protein
MLDMSIISAASQASFKLLFLCAVVAWMSHRGMIPANTSQVMSQVQRNRRSPLDDAAAVNVVLC